MPRARRHRSGGSTPSPCAPLQAATSPQRRQACVTRCSRRCLMRRCVPRTCARETRAGPTARWQSCGATTWTRRCDWQHLRKRCSLRAPVATVHARVGQGLERIQPPTAITPLLTAACRARRVVLFVSERSPLREAPQHRVRNAAIAACRRWHRCCSSARSPRATCCGWRGRCVGRHRWTCSRPRPTQARSQSERMRTLPRRASALCESTMWLPTRIRDCRWRGLWRGRRAGALLGCTYQRVWTHGHDVFTEKWHRPIQCLLLRRDRWRPLTLRRRSVAPARPRELQARTRPCTSQTARSCAVWVAAACAPVPHLTGRLVMRRRATRLARAQAASPGAVSACGSRNAATGSFSLTNA